MCLKALVLSLFMLPACLLRCTRIATLATGQTKADNVYARPGKLVDVGGFRLNLYCTGSGSPAVVFDSGWGDWAPAWSKVQPEIAKWTRTCSYDRAGTGFSAPGPMPRTSVQIAKELRVALHRAGISGPYILVGSAFGGDNVRTFADLYVDEVAGLVLDDADAVDVEPPAMQEEDHRGQARIPADLRECRNLIAEHKPLPMLPAHPGRPPQSCAQRFFFRGLPEAEWSPELNAKLLEIAQTKIAMYDAYASEMEQTAADEIYLQQHQRSLGSRPIRVLTSGNHAVGHLERKPPDTPEHLEYERETTAAQARWLALSSDAKQIFTRNSSEYIQFDEPETLVNAVREVYEHAHSPTAKTSATLMGAGFRDCYECPEMVIIPAGHFVMGASPGEDERENAPDYFRGHSVPQHSITIQHNFAIARFDVTRDQYAQFVADTKRPDPETCYTPDASGGESNKKDAKWHSPGFPQTGRDPVVCVNWDDAQAYAAWLSAKAGHVYRLPTEAEWEYAARSGTTTARYGSDRPAELCRYINHADLDFSEQHPHESDVNRACRDGFAFTSPVGSFPPNRFGLYDMLGNVWQWTEDCSNDDYKGAPSDGSSWQNGNCGRRVMRGGAYSLIPALVRSAVRLGPKSSARDHSGGFRVAKTIE